MTLKDIEVILFPMTCQCGIIYIPNDRDRSPRPHQCGIVRLQAADSERELITYAKLNTNETCSEI